MKRNLFIILIAALAIIASSCGTTEKVAVTGRSHKLLVKDAEILALSKQQYTEILSKSKLSTDQANSQMVKRVGQRLATAVEAYLREHGAEAEIANYSWEFNLVADNQVNAFCMPGGKIVVYEGILPVTQDEASLAIVLGHEIAHAVAKHSAEQISKQMRQQQGTKIVGGIISVAAGSTVGNAATSLAKTGFSLANLKYSRNNESEADYMGIVFAAMAGYDPQVAIPFWQRMASLSSNKKSEFVSDHPSDENRIKHLTEKMPEALTYYKPQPKETPKTTAKTATKTTTKSKTTAKKK